ncbi:MAG: NUDIX hydrolase [Planctomycetota bacterium]|jgi:ADP-ribose pyrophosphatase|nr:NUDIX hydrolase [Planctomycetota bacterium]
MDEELRYEADRFKVVRIKPPETLKLPDKEVIRHPGAVVIIPWIDPKTLCFIQNFRLSVNRSLIELPAGTMQQDEPPLVTAKRELLEETGYVAEEWEFHGELLMSPGILDESMFVYSASILTLHEQQLEDDERIETLPVTDQEAETWIAERKIIDAKTIAALSLRKLQRST